MTINSISRPAGLPRLGGLRLAEQLPLLAILILQAAFSLSLRNTAFQDEALYLYAGRQYFDWLGGGPAVSEPYARYFSGLPYLYPLLAGALDAWGGLELARLLSLAWMLTATACAYLLGRALLDRESGLLGAALFALQGSVLFLGRLATYDAMCLGLLALSSLLAVAAGRARDEGPARLLGLGLLLAVGTKYAGLLFAPTVVGLLAWEAWRRHGWREALFRVLATGVVLAAAALIAVILAGYRGDSFLAGLQSTTTDRSVLMGASRLDLAGRAALMAGPLFLVALAGALLCGRRQALLALGLLGTALLAPAYHIYKAELISMHKHIAFGLFFAAPLAGLAVARLVGAGAGRGPAPRWLAGLAVCLLIFGAGSAQARGLYAEWANSDELIRVLRTQVRPGGGRILAEESEVPRYYLQEIVSPWQWSHLYWFEYTDASGGQLSGVPAYQAALAEGYFDLVVLRYGPNADTANQIDAPLRAEQGYELIAQLPYYTMFGEGHYWVWRRTGVPATPAAPGEEVTP